MTATAKCRRWWQHQETRRFSKACTWISQPTPSREFWVHREAGKLSKKWMSYWKLFIILVLRGRCLLLVACRGRTRLLMLLGDLLFQVSIHSEFRLPTSHVSSTSSFRYAILLIFPHLSVMPYFILMCVRKTTLLSVITDSIQTNVKACGERTYQLCSFSKFLRK